MTDKPTTSSIGNLKVEVVLLPPAEPLGEAELNERVNDLVKTIRNHGCDIRAKQLAQTIADAEYGGRVQNVETAFPQLTLPMAEGKRGFSPLLDADSNKKLDGQELTASTLAAARWMAEHAGTSSKDVPLDQEFLTHYKASLEYLQGPDALKCSPPAAPISISKTVRSDEGKTR